MSTQPRSPLRSVLRWAVPVTFALLLVLLWGMFLSGGWRAVVSWMLLINAGQILGPLMLLIVVIYALWKRRLSGPVWATLSLALFSLWPAGWGFGLLPVTFPASREETSPSASVRLPSNEPLRVAWGGDRVAVNYHAASPDQRWAYDLVVEPAMHGSSKLQDYGCYGKPVVAPVSARVHHAIDGQPDQVPGTLTPNRENPQGNAVVLGLETGTYLVIAHLKPGSVLVRAGDRVKEGDLIGQCGNSGNTSEPHIHIHHQRQDPKVQVLQLAEGLPLDLRDHGGPAMPGGGIDERDGKLILSSVREANRQGEVAERPENKRLTPIPLLYCRQRKWVAPEDRGVSSRSFPPRLPFVEA